MTTLYTIILLCSLALSFFLSGMEAGVFALSRLRVRRLMREGSAAARQLHDYLDHPEDFLWTIVVGNTLANFVTACLSVLALQDWLGQQSVWFWVIFVPGGFVFYALCDLFPKMLFRLYPNRLCLMFLRPFRAVYYVLRPIVWLVSHISALTINWFGGHSFTGRVFGSREELRQVMQESAKGLTNEERGMINRVLDLQTNTIGSIMVPIAKAITVTTKTPVTELLKICRERGLSRLPVWQADGDRQRIAGLMNVRSLLYESKLDPARTAGDYLKPAAYLDEDRRLEDAMRQLQRSGQRLAIVLDRNRQEVGVVSLQDILKAVFGELKL